jgi:hypothetical protein
MGPADIVGLLADGDRLRVVAALVLGGTTSDEVQRATGLDGRRTVKALGRLVDGGLVEQDAHGYRLVEEEIRRSAREAAPADGDEHGDEPDADRARVLRAFVKDGRLVSIPTSRPKRLHLLDVLVQAFEPGVRYTEKRVNLELGKWHPDVSALRRYLVDEGFLEREPDGRRYWRAGGSFDPSQS